LNYYDGHLNTNSKSRSKRESKMSKYSRTIGGMHFFIKVKFIGPRESVLGVSKGFIDKQNPISDIPHAVLNFFLINKSKAIKTESVRDEQDLSSNLSIETSNGKDQNTERIYRIFLVCWFLHAILGIITLFMDWDQKAINPHAYNYIILMTFKWFASAFLTLIFAFFFFIFFKIFLRK
jgi:hypothetical protein